MIQDQNSEFRIRIQNSEMQVRIKGFSSIFNLLRRHVRGSLTSCKYVMVMRPRGRPVSTVTRAVTAAFDAKSDCASIAMVADDHSALLPTNPDPGTLAHLGTPRGVPG